MNFWTFLDRNIGEIIFGLIVVAAFVGFCGLPHVDGSGCGVHVELGKSNALVDGGAP